MPDFLPARHAGAIAGAAQRFDVAARLLSAHLHAESGFNPFAVSSAGAQGIAQFMPGTGAAMGLSNPFDVPPYPETRGCVARILGCMGGAGDLSGGGLAVRLVR